MEDSTAALPDDVDDVDDAPASEAEASVTDEPVDAVGQRLAESTAVPVAAGSDPGALEGETRECSSCGESFPKLEVNGSPPRCAPCTDKADQSMVINANAPTNVVVAQLVEIVTTHEADIQAIMAKLGMNDGAQE